jgi:ABC-type transport system substrate-binding protein
VLFKQRWLGGKIPMLVYALGAGNDSYTILSVFAPTQSRSNWMGSPKQPGFAPQLDECFAQLSSAPTNDARTPIFEKCESLMVDYAMYIPVFQGNLVVAASSDVGGLNTDSLENIRFWQLT